jgi:phosphatidylserine/phosphatidylglycerophosphate/cardiolipin synthase-like enzyme
VTTPGVAPIASITPIATILPIQAAPQAVRILVSPNAFNVLDLPANVQLLFRRSGSTAWRDAARTAVTEGVNPQRIADIIFFMAHRERMAGDIGRPIEPAEPAFVKLRAEWDLYLTIAQRFVRPSRVPDVFLPEQASRKYEEFIAAQTTGKVTLMVHGRNWDGKGTFRDVTDTYDEMQRVVDSLSAGDTLYIANWQFAPWAVPIPAGASTLTRTWQHLLTEKAAAGVTIRIIIAQHPPGSIFMTNIPSVDVMINALPAAQIDNFKYLVSAHPDVLGSHHQKFMIARKGKSTVAFCGGLDLSFNRVPQNWAFNFVWHDVVAKLEGRITGDFERQFVELWNRDRLSSATPLLAGWKPHEQLKAASASGDDAAGALNKQAVQLHRTVSLGPNPGQTQRDDIWRGYFRIIGRSRRFLYLENQYYHEPALADAIVKQVQSAPGMIVIIVAGTGTDDRTTVDPKATGFERAKQEALVDVAQNQFALRLEFFKRLQGLHPTHLRVYTLNYAGGITHTKLIMGDDEVLSAGSANANPRGFFTDTEINFALDHAETAQAFRHQLWAHNLGIPPTDVAKWSVGEFFRNWDTVADSNLRLQKTPTKMVGEGVIPFKPWDPKDPRFERGKRGPIRVPFLSPRVLPDGVF